jgi:hypothetical protein
MNRMIVVLLGAVLTTMVAGSAMAGPELTIPEEVFDFGYIPQNSKVSHVFWLRNTGDEELRIAKINPGCGCTQAPLDKQVVQPGDSARLEIIFSSKLYFNRVVKKPVIELENTPDPRFVEISSYVIPRPDSAAPLRLDPFKLDISQYGEAVRDRAKFSLTNVSDQELAITIVAPPDEFGVLTMPGKIGPGETVEAELVLKPGRLGEELEKSFTFQVNDEYSTRYTIPVRRKLKDPNAVQFTAPGGD